MNTHRWESDMAMDNAGARVARGVVDFARAHRPTPPPPPLFVRRWLDVVVSLRDDADATAHVGLELIECHRTSTGWTVTTSGANCTVIGYIHAASGTFMVHFEGHDVEPFELDTFDEALDYFVEYQSAMQLGRSSD